MEFRFEAEQEYAFEQLKMALVSKSVLKIYRVGAETKLHTDASKFGYGAMLLQRDDGDGGFHPVYFASGKTTSAEELFELRVRSISDHQIFEKVPSIFIGYTFQNSNRLPSFRIDNEEEGLMCTGYAMGIIARRI